MAQWIAHWTSNPGVAGSSPAQGVYFKYIFFVFFFCWVRKLFYFVKVLFILKDQQIIRVGVVGNISACHADARGSIPRRGVKK